MYNRGSKRSAKRTTTRKYRPQVIEALESRQLLTTLFGGGTGLARTYFYATNGATIPNAQITIYGNVTAEFIFMHGNTEQVGLRTLNGNVLGLSIFDDNLTTPTGSDLFAIYVSQSDINSFISVSAIDPTTRALTPFGGGAGFNISPNGVRGTFPFPASVPGGVGSLILGSQTHGAVVNDPIIKTNLNGAAFGVRPAGLDDLPDDADNDLSAGLVVANGNDLGKFLFDGEVYGKVHVDGSMNLFYGGWILTGDAGAAVGDGISGLPTSLVDPPTAADAAVGETFGHIVPRQNFYIGGDLQQLLSSGEFGWDGTFGTGGPLAPYYLSGVDIYARGRLGNVESLEGSAASIFAANMDPAVAGFVRPIGPQLEVEGLGAATSSGVVNGIPGQPNVPTSDFAGGLVYRPGNPPTVPFRNDTFNSFQFLGTFSSARGNDIIDVIGNINAQAVPHFDPNDYYGVALKAGQTVNVQLQSLAGNAHVGVFDPDGRLIAEDYSNVTTPRAGNAPTSLYTFNVPFQFTADRPGIYRFAIGNPGDIDFAAGATTLVNEQYELFITNAGAMAIGGVRAGHSTGVTDAGDQRMLDIANVPPVVGAETGDVGGIYVGGWMYVVPLRDAFRPAPPTAPGGFAQQVKFGSFQVNNGSLRALDASALGVNGTYPTGPDLFVPKGDVGLVQTRDAAEVMELNPSLQLNFNTLLTGPIIPTTPTTPTKFVPADLAVGGNYQVINSLSRFTGGVVANGGMGTLRAGSIAGRSQSIVILDADNKGFDGKSDLIDVAGSIDGPALYHGPGGNFRYMRVGGGVTQDTFFGAIAFPRVAQDFGKSVSFTDDSGSTINLTPIGNAVANPNFDPNNPLNSGPQLLQPQLSTLAYPVRSGGVIVMDVQSTGSLAVNSVGGAFNATAEISRIEVDGTGLAPVRKTVGVGVNTKTTIEPAFTSTAQNNDLSVVISGSAITDVAYIAGMTAEPAGNFFLSTNPPSLRSSVTSFGNLTKVSNMTGGEILQVSAATLGSLTSTGPIGITRTTVAGTALNFIAPLGLGAGYGTRTDMPFQSGDTVVGTAFPFNGQTFGIAINGDIATIRSNVGLGNIVTNGAIGSIVANADKKNNGSLHEGIEAPIYARGTTFAGGAVVTTILAGSIISVDIGEGMGSAGSGDFARTGIFAANQIGTIAGDKGADIRGDIFYGLNLNSLSLNNGSLIDANIVQSDIAAIASIREGSGAGSVGFVSNGGIFTNTNSISIKGNGGIIGTTITSLTINSISVDGFGIISSNINTSFAGFINKITVGGYGIRDTIINGGGKVGTIDVTGTGKNLPTNQVSTSVRQSEFVRADPQLNFGFDPFSGRALTPINDIHAALGTSQATPSIAGATDTGAFEDSRVTVQGNLGTIKAQTFRGDPAFDRISVSNSIGTLQSRGLINGLGVVTGKINSFLPGSDVLGLHMTISGPLTNVTIKGSLGGGSSIDAIGPNGRIDNLTIKKNLNGTVHAVQTMGTINIGGNLNGTLKVDAHNRGGLALKKLTIGGTMANGALDIGEPGVVANVGQIIIGKSLGASSADTLHVSGNIDKLQVGGTINSTLNIGRNAGTIQTQQINGPVNVGGTLTNLNVTRGGLRGALTVGKLTSATISGGVSGNVSANNGINTMTVKGNVAPNITIKSDFGSINTLKVSGEMDGGVNSAGKIGQITVGSNLGNGVDPLTIAGPRLGLLQVGGSIRKNVTVDINGPIDSLIVGKNVDEGAVIRASALTRQQIGGQVFGSLLIG